MNKGCMDLTVDLAAAKKGKKSRNVVNRATILWLPSPTRGYYTDCVILDTLRDANGFR